MDQIGNGNFVTDSDIDVETKKQINLQDQPELVARLQAKLEEYRERESKWSDMSYDHPELRALKLGEGMFKGDILETVLELASSRDTSEQPIGMNEVAEIFEERFGLDLTATKEAPVIFDDRFGKYCHDQAELFTQGGQLNLAFSNAYWIIRGYTTGETNAISGGTGLPEVAVQ